VFQACVIIAIIAPVSTANIRLSRRNFKGTNAPSYYASPSPVVRKKNFYNIDARSFIFTTFSRRSCSRRRSRRCTTAAIRPSPKPSPGRSEAIFVATRWQFHKHFTRPTYGCSKMCEKLYVIQTGCGGQMVQHILLEPCMFMKSTTI